MKNSLDKYKDPTFNNLEDEKISKKDLIEFLKNNLRISIDINDGYLYLNLNLRGEDLPFSASSIYLGNQNNE